MNILFCYPTIFNPLRGGIERVTDLIAKELYNKGHNIFFLHNKKPIYKLSFSYPVNIDFFPSTDYHNKINIDWYHKYLVQNNIDIVINQTGKFGDSILYNNTGGYSEVLSVIHDNPGINFLHYFGEISKYRPNRGNIEIIKRPLRCLIFPKIYLSAKKRLINHYKWLNINTEKVILLSDKFIDEFKTFKGDINKVCIIPNPLSFPINKVDKKENIIIWVGRMDNQKRPDLMIKIWKKLNQKDWKLIMIGDGDLLDKTKKKANNLRNIEFLGFTDPFPYYQKAKILCLTSSHEGFGMVLTEAMSQGCIPIAFRSYKSIEDIIYNNKQLVSPFNINEYVRKLRNLINDKILQEELKIQDYANIEKFKIENVINQWENLLKKITDK